MMTNKDFLILVKQFLLRRREYRWQSVKRLASRAQLPYKKALAVLAGNDDIKLGKTSSGLIIVRHKYRTSC